VEVFFEGMLYKMLKQVLASMGQPKYGKAFIPNAKGGDWVDIYGPDFEVPPGTEKFFFQYEGRRIFFAPDGKVTDWNA